jgi:hypothetical protein
MIACPPATVDALVGELEALPSDVARVGLIATIAAGHRTAALSFTVEQLRALLSTIAFPQQQAAAIRALARRCIVDMHRLPEVIFDVEKRRTSQRVATRFHISKPANVRSQVVDEVHAD